MRECKLNSVPDSKLNIFLNGIRLLSPKTVDFMTTNHLAAYLLPIMLDPSVGYYTQGYGFGFGFRVLADVAASGNLGSEGMY